MIARFHGRASHAGMFPEEGRSAIAAAARAVADMRLGRVDEDSTANVGIVAGGTAGEHRPGVVRVTVEARSHDDAKLGELIQEMLDAFAFGANAGECEVETEVRQELSRLPLPARPTCPSRLAAAALAACGIQPTYGLSGGAADANVFNERGSSASTSRTGWSTSTRPTSGSPSPTWSGWSTSRSRSAMPLSLRRGRVTAIVERHEGLVRLEVDGAACVAYPQLTGPVALGDEVLVNVQARELRLGSGGFDVLHANLTRGLELPPDAGAHVMKLPYTSVQVAVRHAEEDGPLADSLDGMPVVCCSVHSQVAPVCAALRGASRRVRPARGRRAAGRALGRAADAEGARAARDRDRRRRLLRRRRRLRHRLVGAGVGEGGGLRRRASARSGPGSSGRAPASGTAGWPRRRPRTPRPRSAAGR